MDVKYNPDFKHFLQLIVPNKRTFLFSLQIIVFNIMTSEDSETETNIGELLKDPDHLDAASTYLYESLLDDATVGVFLEIHHLYKSGNLTALEGVPEENTNESFAIISTPNHDIFGTTTAKKPFDCVCPNCERSVAASRFAPHLEKCMGMGRISSRIASRRLAKEIGNSNHNTISSVQYLQANIGTDDEDDTDWSSDKRRKKLTPTARSNGAKKNNGK